MRTVALLLAVAVASLGVAQDPVTIARKPVLGETRLLTGKVRVEVMNAEMLIESVSEATVLEVKPGGGWVIKSKPVSMKQSFNGNESEASADDLGPGSTREYDARGVLVRRDPAPDDDASAQITGMFQFLLPEAQVVTGTPWEVKLAKSEVAGTEPITFTYTLVAQEDVEGEPAYKVSFAAKEEKEDPTTSAGTLWVSVATGELLKLTGEFKNAVAQGMKIDGQVDLVSKKK